MPTDRPSRPSAEHRLAVRKLFDAVFTFAWRALDRFGVSAADREDIAQNVAIAALRRWSTYREGSGTPGQWLWGIVRNEHRAFLRAQGRLPVLAGDDLLEVPTEAPSTEESASQNTLVDQLLAALPIEQRRVVMLYEIVGLTYREIAAFEGISKSEAHDRHKTGMRALAAAAFRVEGGRRRSVAALPLSLAEVTGIVGEGGPSPQACDAAWQRNVMRLGLFSSAARSPWLRRAVAGAFALFSVLTVASTPERDPQHAPVAAEMAAVRTAAASPVVGAETIVADAKRAPNTTAYEPLPTVARAPEALSGLTWHEQRFPGGQHAPQRARLRELACARLRAVSSAAAMKPPCADPSRPAGGSQPSR